MALRAFHANPSLGGFGGESGGGNFRVNSHASEKDCDAFAQIVKELVDNAVDACKYTSKKEEAKRIRVVIERIHDTGSDEDYTESNHVLRVTVSDNGIGMDNIQDCVNAFRTSKTGNDDSEEQVENTAGRYGIGLTLCLLHAQRLVPNSCASITSATCTCQHFLRSSYVVDTDGDSVVCVKQEQLPKNSPEESGTAVSLLVPGGATAARAWPRLAEYFARFQLSLGLQCGLEVLAPSLSTIPLFIRPASQRGHTTTSSSQESNAIMQGEDNEMWTDGLEETSQVLVGSQEEKDEDENMADAANPTTLPVDTRRNEILKAANTFLKRPVELKNVAHAPHPIGRTSRRSSQDVQPTLEVDIIVYAKADDNDSQEEDSSVDNNVMAETPSAKLMLVRMVNGVPLLDGAEATACGLVQGIAQKQSTWNSFGLHISSSVTGGVPAGFNDDDSSVDSDEESTQDDTPRELFVPTYAVRDSDQVAPFIRSGIHDLYDMDNNEGDDDSSVSGDDGSARAGRKGRNGFLPAHLRLGNILLIVQIHAKPSSLPLPTLSKGRLPMNNHPIGSALELGLMDCLTSLQKTSPGLLLTSTQLKETIRDTRYVPSLSAALALVISKSQNSELKATMTQTIQRWAPHSNSANPGERQQQDDDSSNRAEPVVPNVISMDSNPPSLADSTSMDDEDSNPTDDQDSVSASTLGPLLERRLRLVCQPKKRTTGRRGGQQQGQAQANDSDSDVSLDGFLESGWGPEPEFQAMQEDDGSASKDSFSEKSLSASSASSSSSEKRAVARTEPSSGRRLDASEDNFDDDSWF